MVRNPQILKVKKEVEKRKLRSRVDFIGYDFWGFMEDLFHCFFNLLSLLCL